MKFLNLERVCRHHKECYGNLLLCVKRTACQWWTCQFWCSLTNANQAAQCWAVSTVPTRGRQALVPPSWSLFVTVWSETCSWVACWRSFCRASVVPPHKGADTGPAAELLPLYSLVQLSSYNDPSPGVLSLQGDTADHLGTAHTDVPSWMSRTPWATWMGCRGDKGTNKMQN